MKSNPNVKINRTAVKKSERGAASTISKPKTGLIITISILILAMIVVLGLLFKGPAAGQAAYSQKPAEAINLDTESIVELSLAVVAWDFNIKVSNETVNRTYQLKINLVDKEQGIYNYELVDNSLGVFKGAPFALGLVKEGFSGNQVYLNSDNESDLEISLVNGNIQLKNLLYHTLTGGGVQPSPGEQSGATPTEQAQPTTQPTTPAPETCSPSWQEESRSLCVNSTRTVVEVDKNKCDLSNYNKTTTSSCSGYEDEYESYVEVWAELEDEFADLKSDYYQAIKKEDAEEISIYEQKISDLGDELESLEDDIADLINNLEDQDEVDEVLLEEAEDLQSEVNKLQGKAVKLLAGEAVEEESVPEPTAFGGICEAKWECSAWSGCIDGQRTRVCLRIDSCEAKLISGEVDSVIDSPKPLESEFCYTAEEDVTSETLPVVEQKEKSFLIWYILIFVLIVGLGAGAWFTYSRKKGKVSLGVSAELRSIYESGTREGMTKQQVTQKLIEKGWDDEVLKDFLLRK
ncbi:MAG TPA: hypothetical protein VJC39_03470 [Candidatus Nanoarchaeia archaeon]|nr:hypothetical protein [Candidatus Nanoarchaeia archaeon]